MKRTAWMRDYGMCNAVRDWEWETRGHGDGVRE
jgi:hypothetical protein